MNIKNARELFLDYFEGELSENQQAEFKKLLEGNTSLKAELEDYKKLVELEQIVAKTSYTVDSDFSKLIMNKLENSSPLNVRSSKMLTDYLKACFRPKIIVPMTALGTMCLLLLITNQDKVANQSDNMQLARVEQISQSIEEQEQYDQVKVISPSGTKSLSDKTKSDGHTDSIQKNQTPVIAEELSNTLRDNSRQKDKSFGSRKLTPEPLPTTEKISSSKRREDSNSFKRKHDSKIMPSNTSKPTDADDSSIGEGKISELNTGLTNPPAPTGRTKTYQNLHDKFVSGVLPRPQQETTYRIATNTEKYGQYEENQRIRVSKQAVSTFSIDVDTGSYTNARRILRSGQLPPADSVRVEEYINYFNYNYPVQTSKPFSLNYEIAPSPLDNNRYFLKMGIKARDASRIDSKGWNLVFLVDTSGSMSQEIDLLQKSLKILVNKMRSSDRIAIVTYAGNAGLALPSTSGKKKNDILRAIEKMRAGGSTHGSAGINLAYEVAERNFIRGSVNRIILATDGDFNVGVQNFSSLVQLIKQKRKNGVTLTTLGLGSGNYNEKNLEQLANKGNGNYFYIDSFSEARKVLADQLTANMEVVAKDVKLQIEFNPAHVREYRLIGYDNRKLRNRDFNDDTIDAGEIGSGHTVTAFYEIVLTNSELGKNLEETLRYQEKNNIPELKPSKQHSGELAFLKVRYKAPEASTSQLLKFPLKTSDMLDDSSRASDDFNFASAVVYFGQILRKSQFSGDTKLSQVINLAQKYKGEDKNGYRREFIELVKNARELSGD